jgi:trimethylamine--corrinoid protein Co-methyltransferase
MPSETPALQPIVPQYHLRILSDEQLADFRSATLEILEEVGNYCPSKKALDIFAEHGAQVDYETQIVKIPPDVVLEAMSHAPRYYTMGARDDAFDLKLDGTAMYCATDGCGIATIDFETGKRRPSTKDDCGKMALVSDYLSAIGFYWPIVSAQDYPHNAPLHELDASFNNTIKHVQTETVMGELPARYAVEMAKVIAGNEVAMKERPPLSSLICTIAPLAQDKDGLEAALIFAEAGIPVGFMSMAATSLTAPASISGTFSIGDAEIVAAMTLMQLAYPGSPTYHSLMTGVMHPKTGAFIGSAEKASLGYPVGTELAHMWGVPTLAGVGAVADTSSWESALGVAASLLLCALCGAETGSGFGLREMCTLLTPEALVLDSEIYHTARSEASGLDTSRKAMALDVIKDVGPMGNFMYHKHTLDHIGGLGYFDLLSQPKDSGGYQDPIELAIEKTHWILENHQPDPLSDLQQRELKRILRTADQEIGI